MGLGRDIAERIAFGGLTIGIIATGILGLAHYVMPTGFSGVVVSESQLPGNVYSIKVTPDYRRTGDKRIFEIHVPNSSSPEVRSLDDKISPGTVVGVGYFGGLLNGSAKYFHEDSPAVVPPGKIHLDGRPR